MADFFFPRNRMRIVQRGYAVSGQFKPSGVSPFQAYSVNATVKEECDDQLHPNWNPRGSATKGDVGGPFWHYRTGRTYSAVARANTSTLQGTVGATPMASYVPTGTSQISEAALNAKGATYISRVLPTNPVASMSTFLGELRADGLPHLPGAATKEQAALFRSAGSEYLNYQFGWVPFLSDIRKFAYAVKNSHELLHSYKKGSDKKIRARYGTPGAAVISSYSGGSFATPPGRNILCDTKVQESVDISSSFSGAFRYHLPVPDSFLGRMALYESYSNHLLGTRVTPETLWNIAPWSWAVDWFTNTGDVIHNISQMGADGLVMQYGYAMQTTRQLTEISSNVTISTDLPVGTYLSRYDETVYRRRVAANPYGFGITDSSLSAKQTAILVALGLSRGPRQHP